MSERGVFAVDRGIFDHPVFAEKRVFSKAEAWLWMLAEAEWKPRKRGHAGKVVSLERGQLAHSIRFMADAWGWHRAKVERFLTCLKTETMIETQAETGVTIITICNYDEYQRVSKPKRDSSETPVETAPRQDRDKPEDRENISSLRSDTASAPDERFELFWSAYPKRSGSNPKPPAKKSFQRALKRAAFEEIMAGVQHYAGFAEGEDPRFVKQATTWLNQDCWTDRPTISPIPKTNGGRNGPSVSDQLRAMAQQSREGRESRVDRGAGGYDARMLPGPG